jgi:hypothetical protein
MNIPLRYNIDNEEMQHKANHIIYAFKPNLIIDKIIIRPDTFIIDNLNPNSKDSLVFFKVIAQSKLIILSHIHIIYQEAKPAGALQDREQPARFLKHPENYYSIIGNNRPERIKNIKNLVDIIPDHRDKLSKYIKNRKINSIKSDDLIEFADFYNSL